MLLVIYLLFVIYPISVDLGGRTPISVSLPAIDFRLHYALLTKPESRCRILAKYFFFFAFLWTHDANVQTLDQTRLIYKAMYKNWTKKNFLPRNFIFNAENPERVRLAHLACSSSQSEQRNRFILPTRGFSHTIKLPVITSFWPETCGSTLRFFSVSVLPSNKFLAQWHDLNNDEKDLYSRAPYPRKFGNPPIPEILVITWPYARPSDRPSTPKTYQCKIP